MRAAKHFIDYRSIVKHEVKIIAARNMSEKNFKKGNKADISDTVLPIMNIICMHPLIPYKIELNQDNMQFTYRKGGLMKQVKLI